MNTKPKSGSAVIAAAFGVLAANAALAQGLETVICESEGVICPGEEAVFDKPEEASRPEEEVLDENARKAAIENESGFFGDRAGQLGISGGENPADGPLRDQPDIWGEEADDGWLE